MKSVVIASKNPVKIQAVKNAFQRMFPEKAFEFRGISVPSRVSDQPMSHEETIMGAENRASAACSEIPMADYWVGIEGGVQEMGQDLAAFAWMIIQSETQTGRSCTGTFFLPPRITALIRNGYEMGDADDIVFGKTNSKQQDGAAGLLTQNVINRIQRYEHALILALIPFKNEKLYNDGNSTD